MNSDKKFLHILDPAIISQSTIELFEKLNYTQRFVIVALDPQKWRNFAEAKSNVRVIDFHNENVVKVLIEEINDADIIFAQAMSKWKAKAIKRVKDKRKVFIWGLWGYGLYNMVQYFKGGDSEIKTTLEGRKSLIDKAKDYHTFNNIYKKAVQKIDICLFLLESDFNLLGEIVEHKAVWRSTCYQTIENLLSDPNFEVKGNSILLGNSCTPSNRHEFVFDKLKTIENLNQKIIVPLNYGDDVLKKRILQKGHEILGENFDPLTDFMPLQEYTNRIQGCSQVIMAHERQQAFGTIMMMLYGGAKLYLSEVSPFYRWLKELEVKIYSIETDLTNEIQSDLETSFKLSNREIIKAILSENSILQELDAVMLESITLSNKKSVEKSKS